MRLPTLGAAITAARATFLRFPAAVLSALGASATTLVWIDHTSDDGLARLLVTFVLGLPLFVASGTAAERYRLPRSTRWIVDLAIGAGLAGVYLLSLRWTDPVTGLRFIQLLLGAHLLAAVGAWLAGRALNGFWQFNRYLLLRWLLAGVYAFVLWGGLSIALLALDKLFGLDVPFKAYPRLLAVMGFGFHSWFFLAGMPRDLDALEGLEDYPVGLKIFTQMVLMPLVAVYLVILTAYLGKVLATRAWPSGWIGFLVSSVAAAGVLALLLVHPLRTRLDSRWVRWYGRWYFVALLPSLAMLLVAVARRIGQYGVTEPRYFLLVLALWLTALALWYAVTASENIKLIPITLAAVAILTVAGPWGAYRVARRSQEHRFAALLAANDLTGRRVVSFDDRREMSAILRYLAEVHGPGSVAQLPGVGPARLRDSADSRDLVQADEVARAGMARLGLGYVDRWSAPIRSDGSFSFFARGNGTQDVRGFDALREVSYPGLGWIGTGPDSVLLAEGPRPGTVAVQRAGTTLLVVDLRAGIDSVLAADTVRGGGTLLRTPIVVEAGDSGLRVRLVIRSVSGQRKEGALRYDSWYGAALVAGLRPHLPN